MTLYNRLYRLCDLTSTVIASSLSESYKMMILQALKKSRGYLGTMSLVSLKKLQKILARMWGKVNHHSLLVALKTGRATVEISVENLKN